MNLKELLNKLRNEIKEIQKVLPYQVSFSYIYKLIDEIEKKIEKEFNIEVIEKVWEELKRIKGFKDEI